MSLFNNPMVQSARNAMSPEEQENYKKKGENFYTDEMFEQLLPQKIELSGEELNDLMTPLEPDSEFVAYVLSGVKSGLHPKDLEPEEKEAVERHYGKEWYTSFGYSLQDMEEGD